MKLFGWKKNTFKVLGVSVFRTRCKNGKQEYRIFDIPVWRCKTPLADLFEKVRINTDFDTRMLDAEIEKNAPAIEIKSVESSDAHRIAYLVTEFYDMGGHTKCVREQAKCLTDTYTQKVFFTQLSDALKKAPKTMAELEKSAQIDGENIYLSNWKKTVPNLVRKIAAFNPRVLLVFINPADVFGTMILARLKRLTNIRIIYCPHASHFPNLGVSFADITLEALPTTMYLTQKYRHFDNTVRIPMLAKKQEDFPVFSDEAVARKRAEIGVAKDELCTMSGAYAGKFFDNTGSEYFRTIKKLLERNPNVRHVILTQMTDRQQDIVDRIFDGSTVRERLTVLPYSNEYELIFKCADVFIDSFPISSALAIIDLMRLKVPYVVKINRENAHWSFHEYQSSDYPYMFEHTDDLLNGVEKLLSDKAERTRIVEANFNHYMNTFEGNSVKKRLCDIIDNADNLERFYSGKINGNYQFKELGL